MHANFHYAVGIIIASFTSFVFQTLNLGEITLTEYILIVFCSFGVDFDFLFSKYAKNHNHRNLFTHSIFIPLILIILGVISIHFQLFQAMHTDLIDLFQNSESNGESTVVVNMVNVANYVFNEMLVHNEIILICGLAYLSHILFDLIDWGVKLFFWGKTYGFFLLVSQDEKNLTKKNLDEWVSEKSEGKQSFFVSRYYSNTAINILEFIFGTLGFFILFTFNAGFWYMYIGYFLLLDMHLEEKKKIRKQ